MVRVKTPLTEILGLWFQTTIELVPLHLSHLDQLLLELHLDQLLLVLLRGRCLQVFHLPLLNQDTLVQTSASIVIVSVAGVRKLVTGIAGVTITASGADEEAYR